MKTKTDKTVHTHVIVLHNLILNTIITITIINIIIVIIIINNNNNIMNIIFNILYSETHHTNMFHVLF